MTIRNHVQKIGLRNSVKEQGTRYGIDGIVFNNRDGSVTIYCNDDRIIDSLEIRRDDLDLDMVELPEEFILPKGFYIVDTDTKEDKEDRLAIGLKHLESINNNISNMDNKMTNIDKNTATIPQLVEGQNKIVEGQNNMLAVLERIEKKL